MPDKQDEENLEMNVIGNNFSLLAVNVNQKKNRKQRYSTSSRESLLIVDYEGINNDITILFNVNEQN